MMNTTKITTVLIAMFVAAMAAGIVTGRLTARTPTSPPPPLPTAMDSRSPLTDALQLTPEQAQQMRPVWEAARDTVRSCTQEFERIQKDNDAQLNALLSESQKARYAKITQENHDKLVAEESKRKEAFRQAVEQTKKILSEEQWKAYEQILKNQVGNVPGATDSISLAE